MVGNYSLSTKRPKAAQKKPTKPAKPYSDFPLFPHATRRWAKKIRGKFHYFGPWNDPDAALAKYLAEKDYLLAGKQPPPQNVDGMTVTDLCNKFLTAKTQLVNTNELRPRSWKDYHRTSERLIAALPKWRLVDDLSVEDFKQLRTILAKTHGPVALGNEIQRVRSIFKFAYEEGLIDKPIRYGQSFKKPTRKTLRIQRARKIAKHGKRMFQPDELRTMIDTAGHHLKAMILLGVNCGLGNHDCGELPISALDLNGGWIDYARVKTGVQRRCPLWPETVAALRDSLAKRPTPKHPDDADLVFVTKYGKCWTRTYGDGSPDDAIGKETAKLLHRLKLKRYGVGFYALRHTFETIGGESRDQVAVDQIMGHIRDDMASVYREGISDERLLAVTNTVRSWCFPQTSA